jgi:hypothetical protein
MTVLSLLAGVVLAGTNTMATAACVPGLTGDANMNTCIGDGALKDNLGKSNTALGYQALFSNLVGWYNTAVGFRALYSNYNGWYNTAIGQESLFSNTSGEFNTAVGHAALRLSTTGRNNTAIGQAAMAQNTTGSDNTALGGGALISNTGGAYNTATGSSALQSNTTGKENTASGVSALSGNTTGSANTAVGYIALLFNAVGNNNTALGHGAGAKQNGSNNTSVGYEAGYAGSLNDERYLTGNNNIALGFQAGSQWSTGSNNIAIGSSGTASDAGAIRIGERGRQNRTFIAGIRGSLVQRGVPVLIDASNRLGMATSLRQFKQDIQPMGDASSKLMQLKPVSFRYMEAVADGSKPLQFGLIAEEVEEVMPELVVRNAEGTIETVAYHVLPSLLLNEYQKQNRELAQAKANLASTEARLHAVEAEMAAMKLALSRLAATLPAGDRTLASAME